MCLFLPVERAVKRQKNSGAKGGTPKATLMSEVDTEGDTEGKTDSEGDTECDTEGDTDVTFRPGICPRANCLSARGRAGPTRGPCGSPPAGWTRSGSRRPPVCACVCVFLRKKERVGEGRRGRQGDRETGSVCVCARVRVRVCACVHACVRACVHGPFCFQQDGRLPPPAPSGHGMS
jgi:hypothetical protein